MKIGELARRVGIPIDTVRYYERNGLLPPPARRASGYREYDECDIPRLQFVLRAKALGFSLQEVRELLDLSVGHPGDSADIRAAAQAKLADIEEHMARLGRIRDALQAIVRAGPSEALERCPLREAMLDGGNALR